MSMVSKSYVPFTCKFPMVIHSVPFHHKRCRSKTNFYVFSYDKISLKFCASFRFFLEIFMEKLPKIRYLSYVRRGIGAQSMSTEKKNFSDILLKLVVCSMFYWPIAHILNFEGHRFSLLRTINIFQRLNKVGSK